LKSIEIIEIDEIGGYACIILIYSMLHREQPTISIISIICEMHAHLPIISINLKKIWYFSQYLCLFYYGKRVETVSDFANFVTFFG